MVLLDLINRKKILNKLNKLLISNELIISEVLLDELGRHQTETLISEIIVIKEELKLSIANISTWDKPKKVSTPFQLLPAKSYIKYEPFGTVLIIAPWNFPFHLSIVPAIGAVAAGNKVIIKTSPLAPKSSTLLKKIINEELNSEFIQVIEGNENILEEIINHQKIDFIFFTGSPSNGKKVYQVAAKYMLPIVMELGGQNPLIFHKDGNLNAVKRIAWGKLLNAGQACLAPNHFFIHISLKDVFVNKLIRVINDFFGENPIERSDLTNILNMEKFQRITDLMDENNSYLIYGGKKSADKLKIEPTIYEIPLSELDSNSLIINEVFGPLFPIVYYENLDDVIEKINQMSSPLSIYVFSESNNILKQVENNTKSGSICVNDCLVQGANPNFPFGGVGNSGIGKYHGYNSFTTFSNPKNVLVRSSKFSLIPRFPPYSKKIFNIFKFL